ncbi:MAG: Hsp20/alpha crystallin family protein [Patescibacteria group bacterium]
MKNKRSFFEKLTGAVRLEDEDEMETLPTTKTGGSADPFGGEEAEEEAQLTVDVFQTSSEIVIKTMVAGVKPEDLDVSITRDMVTIHGERGEDRTVSGDDYIHRELYWGSFSRTINLPEEIDVDGAEAVEKHGMLVLRLPKLDKNRQTKLRVKGN